MDVFFVRDYIVNNEYLYPLVILLLTLVLAKSSIFLLEGILKHFHSKVRNFNKRLLSVLEGPIVLLIVLIGIELAVKQIIIQHPKLTNALVTVVIAIITHVLIRVGSLFLDVWSKGMTEKDGEAFHEEVLPLIKSVLSIVLSVIAVMLILQVWGVEVGGLLASLGIAGLILGFAFKQTLENIFGGLSLIIDNTFKKGDLVELETGEIGEILEISLRSTKLMNFDNEIIIMPNGRLANSKLLNLAQPTPTVRVKLNIGVAYGNDPDKVKEVLHDAMKNQPIILKMPKRHVRFEGYKDFAINFEVLFYISGYRKIFTAKDEVLSSIYKHLYKNGIEIPFPIRTIVPSKPGQYDQKWGKKALAASTSKAKIVKANKKAATKKVSSKTKKKTVTTKKKTVKSTKKKTQTKRPTKKKTRARKR